MTLLILHVSDIHLSTARYPDNPILGRVPDMLAAVRSLFLDPEDIKGWLFLVSGDIAYAGLREEYDLAEGFFRQLEAGLVQLFPHATRHTVLIPGNHDCNFTDDDQARQKLIEDPDLDSLEDGSVIDTVTDIQTNFFTFCEKYNGTPTHASGLGRIFSRHEMTVDAVSVEIRAINSAWMSRKHERRDLALPLPYLSAQCKVEQPPTVVITTLHHPYNWFEPSNANGLRELLEETSDIIVTGHEHASNTYKTIGSTGEQNDYIEAGVLQENGDPTSSAFNVILINTQAQTQRIHSFALVSDLYECLNDVVEQPFIRNKNRLKAEFSLSNNFEATLNETDAHYTHPYKSKIVLSDVFLYPDLTELDKNHSKTTTSVIHGADIITHILKKENVVITGSDRAGKTALARMLFKDLRANGKIPMLLSGRELKPARDDKLNKRLDTDFVEQYSSDLKTAYWQLSVDRRAVIIDDYHCLPVTKEFRDRLLRILKLRFGVIVILAGRELPLQELMGHDRESRLLWSFNHCEMMAFGRRGCAEFVRKWYRIGREGLIEDSALVQKAIAHETTISQILGRDLLPPYPIYLLLLLQQLESNNPLDTAAATYGRLYGGVMTAYLAKEGAPGDLEIKITYLSELAYSIYKQRSDHLSDEDARTWHAAYCARYLDDLDYISFRDELVRAQILQYRNSSLGFKYKAGFYYFVANYMSENMSDETVRSCIEQLCAELHNEESANIVLFLCHLSKDDLILKSIVATAGSLFAEYDESDILHDAAFLEKGLTLLDAPVLDESDPETNRLNALDVADKRREGRDCISYTYEREEAEEEPAPVEVTQINSAFKTIQIAGQMLRNFGGKMRGPDRLRLTEACYSLGLRFLRFAFSTVAAEEAELVRALQKTAMERNPDLRDSEAKELAEGLVSVLLEFVMISVVKQIATSVGLERLGPVFTTVLNANPTTGRRLIDFAIRLEHFTHFPEDQALELHREVRKYPITLDVLRRLIYNRFYYFSSPPDVKQRICDKVGIAIEARKRFLDYDKKRAK